MEDSEAVQRATALIEQRLAEEEKSEVRPRGWESYGKGEPPAAMPPWEGRCSCRSQVPVGLADDGFGSEA